MFNIVDLIIIIFLLLGFISGYEKGFIKQGVSTIGNIIVVVLAFLLKNNLSIILYKKLPFFTVGLLKNYSSLNILIYELISFIILLIIFGIILALIVKLSGLLEKMVEGTVILKLPFKLLGGLLGMIECYIALFVILLILSAPLFSFDFSQEINKSRFRNFILNNTVLMSNLSKPLVKTLDEINELSDIENLGTKEFNCKSIKVFRKNNIIDKDSLDYLIENKKIEYNSNKCK